MKQVNIYPATEFIEYFLTKEGYLTPFHFIFPTNDKGEIIGKYINALDLILALGYKYYFKAWEKIKKDYSINIEYSFIVTGGYEDKEILYQEDFLTLNQVVMILNKTTKIRIREKGRLLNFIRDSI